MDKNQKCAETIIECVLQSIDKKIEFLKCDREGVILEINGDMCTVLINNCKYTVKNGTPFEFQKNDKCLVHFINGDQQRKIIIAKL